MAVLHSSPHSSPLSSPLKVKGFSAILNSSPQFSPILSLEEVCLNSFKFKMGENCGELLRMVLKPFTFNGELSGELCGELWRTVTFGLNLFLSRPTNPKAF